MGDTAPWLVAGFSLTLAVALALVLRLVVIRERRQHTRLLHERDDRLTLREATLETKAHTLELREANINERQRALAAAEAEVEDDTATLRKRLEEIADYTAAEARHTLLEQAAADVRADSRAIIRDAEERARRDAEQRARDIVATAVQRCAVDTSAGTVTATIPLPDDALKGRIIGRDGRNIRTFQNVTGVDLVVDETPGSVLLSSFDPLRREVARRTLTTLIEHGGFSPSGIETAYERARRDTDALVDQAGADAATEADVADLAPELLRLLGQLEYRTSYGQNVRRHSIETALVAGALAEELGADAALARRCGLLHDIGKALTHKVKGSHAQVGAEVARRLGEPHAVCHAIAAHHGDIEPASVEAVLTQAADAISASRPGARSQNLQQHCERLTRIEALCLEYEGVDQVFVMRAGRDVRVMVRPDAVDDAGVRTLARRIADDIDEEVAVPGQVTVTVIRDLRSRAVSG